MKNGDKEQAKDRVLEVGGGKPVDVQKQWILFISLSKWISWQLAKRIEWAFCIGISPLEISKETILIIYGFPRKTWELTCGALKTEVSG